MVELKTSLAKGSALLAMASVLIPTGAFSQSPRERFYLDHYLGEPEFEARQIFTGERFPNVVVTRRGTVLATWGNQRYRVRRSEDGGNTWGPDIVVADPGFHGGGVTVDERTDNIFVFVEGRHPPSPLTVYRSSDDGRTWQEVAVTIHPDPNGEVPSMHMNERGITLRHGRHAGRLLRPARVYMGADSYNSAIYSDDGGATWHASAPFPVPATGEGAVAELSDGRVYYNSRRSRNSRMRWIAWSHDGGETWEDPSESDVLPDGPQNVDYGLMAGLVRLPLSGYDILLFSNVDSPGKPEGDDRNWSERRRGTVWASFDGGQTWPVKRLVYEGPFAYSSLAAGRRGTPSQGQIYLQFEGGPGGAHSDGHLARFNLSWVIQGFIDFKVDAVNRGKSLLEEAETGTTPGQYPPSAAARLQITVDSLEEALGNASFHKLIEQPDLIPTLRDLRQNLEREMVLFEISRIPPEGEVMFVQDGVPWAVEAIGTEWQLGDGFLFNQGTGNCLVTIHPLLRGDFHIRAELALDRLDGTAASFVFDVGPPENNFAGSHFGFDSRRHGLLFAEGGFFGPTKTFGPAVHHIEDGVPFLFEAMREGEQLTVFLNGAAVLHTDIGTGPVGKLGLRPWRAEMRVYQFSATGTFHAVPGSGGFTSWREEHFSLEQLALPELSGSMGSIAADRITNFMRYAFGLDPRESGLRSLPKAGFTSNGGMDFLTLTYRRLREFSDVLYHVEATSEPGGGWTPVGPDQEIAVADNGDGTNLVTVRDFESVDENPRRFMRLRVEYVE